MRDRPRRLPAALAEFTGYVRCLTASGDAVTACVPVVAPSRAAAWHKLRQQQRTGAAPRGRILDVLPGRRH
ncbi:MAG TPA: hypothetical protein VK052_06615 [Zeimonas sp.]|nr:hypothetical protein [Zeimonas sp.]